jgi:polysaccharide export outer membrane protein
MTNMLRLLCLATITSLISASSLVGLQAAGGGQTASTPSVSQPAVSDGAELPPEYVIGPGDVLSVHFWRRNDVSADVVVRPDGKISLLLLDDIPAEGLTPEQLRDRIVEKADKLFEDARVTVVVKEVNSRQVFITGFVAKPGPYPLRRRLTVLQLIAMAGGLLDFANSDRIAIMRTVNGKQIGLLFNYHDVRNLKRLDQNIELKPGDTVVVP